MSTETSAPRRRRRLLVIGTALGLLVSGLALLTTTGGEGSPEGWRRAALACADDPSGQTRDFDAEVDCLATVFAVTDGSGLAASMEGLRLAIAQNPRLYESCHSATHRAGAQFAMRSPSDVPAMLSTIDVYTCDDGIVHGLLTGLGKSEPASELLAAAARACLSRNELLRADRSPHVAAAEYGCLDGFGHALWFVHPFDPASSIPGCKAFDESDQRRVCVRGIAMEGAAPADRKWDWKAEEAIATLSRLCSPDGAFADEGLRQGCFAGIGYIVAHRIWDGRDLYVGDGTTLTPEHILAEMSDFPELFRKACSVLPADGFVTCLTDAASSSAPSLMRSDLWPTFCSRFDDLAAVEDHCLLAGRQGTN